MYTFNLKTNKPEKLSQEYQNPKDPVFRDLKEILPGMKDFELRFKVDQIDNPHGLSVFVDKPRFIVEKEKELKEKEEKERKWKEAKKPQDW